MAFGTYFLPATRITHLARLKAESAADSVGFLYKTLAALAGKRGPDVSGGCCFLPLTCCPAARCAIECARSSFVL